MAKRNVIYLMPKGSYTQVILENAEGQRFDITTFLRQIDATISANLSENSMTAHFTGEMLYVDALPIQKEHFVGKESGPELHNFQTLTPSTPAFEAGYRACYEWRQMKQAETEGKGPAAARPVNPYENSSTPASARIQWSNGWYHCLEYPSVAQAPKPRQR